MQKASTYIFILLKNTFIITAVSLLLGWSGGEYSFFEMIFGSIGIYGAILSVCLFLAHVILLILAFIFKNDKSGT
jgi:hypothetical protein